MAAEARLQAPCIKTSEFRLQDCKVGYTETRQARSESGATQLVNDGDMTIRGGPYGDSVTGRLRESLPVDLPQRADQCGDGLRAHESAHNAVRPAHAPANEKRRERRPPRERQEEGPVQRIQHRGRGEGNALPHQHAALLPQELLGGSREGPPDPRPDEPLAFQPPNGLMPGQAPAVALARRLA